VAGLASVPGSVGAKGQGTVDVERSCRSKRVHLTRRDARHVERQMSRRYREQFTFYRCTNCGGYHVAHLVPAALRARAVPAVERPAVGW
jgi:hypothetical protein